MDNKEHAALLAKRQRALAKRIGKEFCGGTTNLKRLGKHGTFFALLAEDDWPTERLVDIAWRAVGTKIKFAAPCHTVIGHAWLVGYNAAPYEAWALVTEPYLDDVDVKGIVERANANLGEWGFTVHALEAKDSSWNPGECVPIVATLDVGWHNCGIATAVRWAFSLSPTTAEQRVFDSV